MEYVVEPANDAVESSDAENAKETQEQMIVDQDNEKESDLKELKDLAKELSKYKPQHKQNTIEASLLEEMAKDLQSEDEAADKHKMVVLRNP